MKVVSKSLILIVISLMLFSNFAIAQPYDTVPVVDGECPEDCWLNVGGSCSCPEDASSNGPNGNGEGPMDNYEKDYQQRYEEFEGEIEFDVDPGLTPDSAFYFMDDFIEGAIVGDNPERALDYKEEKIAEAIIMVDQGMPEEAEMVLEKALEYDEILEEEVTPELEERIEESSIQIQHVMKEIEEDIADEAGWENVVEKVDENFEKEGKIRTAAEIAAKINELCAELAALDPIQYEDTCKTDGDAPDWMRDKHKEWSAEQEKEAKEFGKILGECFATSGRTCRCEDISFYDFQVFCEKMSDLAVECDAGDENACVAMDSEEMPELPDHLEDTFYDIEEEFAREKYGNEKFKPEECEGLGHKECMLVMVELKAPPECRSAIKEAIESGEIRGERGARDICDGIMFDMHAPDECISAGITDPTECARLMMPDECINAGITGEHSSDEMKCKELMKKGRHYGGAACTGEGTIEERLTCLEGAMNTMDDMYYRPEYIEEEGEMTWQCKENRIHWPPDCEAFMRDVWPGMEQQQNRDWERDRMERQEYNQYMPQDGRQLCPDGICDDWERNSGGCWEDCGDTSGQGMDCGPGCYFDFYYNACECPDMMDCGHGCWPEGNTCECSTYGGTDCGPGCWWDDYYGHCECAGCGCPDGSWSENCMCGDMNQGCWCGSMWSDTCDCGPVSGGCQCSWGWSPDCRCDVGGTTCSPGCWWEYDHCECGDRVACASGCWWDDYYGSCQCSNMESCPSNSYTTSSNACDYGMCPSGCNFDYQGCPSGCMTSGGCDCGGGCYSSSCNCGIDCPQTNTGCQCSWGWSDTCDCGTSVNCGSYTDSGSCSGAGGCVWCEGESSPYSCFGSQHVCGSGDTAGCQCSWGWSNTCDCGTSDGSEYCGNGICGSYETSSSCPGDCGGDMTCTTWVSGEGTSCDPTAGICCSDGSCSNMNGPGTCSASSGGCGCADGYWSDNCDCTGHESGESYACYSDSECGSGCVCMESGTSSSWCDCSGGGSTGCECGGSCGWSDTCDCSGCDDAPEEFDCGNGCYSCSGSCDCCSDMTGGVITGNVFLDYWYD